MAEETEDEEGKSKTFSPLLPPSPWDRLLSAPTCRKRPGDLPGLSNCHSCGLHCPPKFQIDKLQTLESQWRVVLLCKCCLARVRSAEACSYCFSKISEEDGGLLDCHECFRRVHLRCAPLERGFVALSELHPDSFTCIDCCPFPKSHSRNHSGAGSRLSLEDLVRDASSSAEKKAAAAACAKEKAQQKALAAMRAAKMARNTLDAVAAVNRVMPDKELALQLHRAMNGSQRASRNRRPLDLEPATCSKKARGSGNSTGRKAEFDSISVCANVEFATEDKAFFESTDKIWLNQSFSLESDSIEKNDQKKELDGHSETSLVEIHVKEEQGSCYNKAINSGRDDNNIGSVYTCCQIPNEWSDTLVLSESGGGAGENSFKSQQNKWFTTHDRHLKKYRKKKYSKRHLRLKGMIRDESQLVPCRPMSCSKAPRTLPIP